MVQQLEGDLVEILDELLGLLLEIAIVASVALLAYFVVLFLVGVGGVVDVGIRAHCGDLVEFSCGGACCLVCCVFGK